MTIFRKTGLTLLRHFEIIFLGFVNCHGISHYFWRYDKVEYEKYFSDTANELEASEIREILSVVKSGDIISMAGGMPKPKSFPVDMIDELTSKALNEKGTEMLQYGTTMGYEGLREQISERMKNKYNVDLGTEQIMVTAGSQQGLFLLGRAFVNEGEDVAVGAPTYLAALTAFKNFKPNYVNIPLDENGMDVDALEKKLENGMDPKFVYVIPTFQNPTGVTMNEERREKLVNLAEEHDFLIMEDGPYNELRYKGDDVDPIISYDNSGRTIFLGTFSKIFAPGFRLGWVAGDEGFIRKMEIIKQSLDLCTNVVSQYIAYEYMKTGKIDEQIEKIKDLYKPKQKVLIDSLEEYMPSGIEWTVPKGGMFSWVTLPEKFDTEEMFDEAIDNDVAYVPGHAFYANNPQKNTMRLNYTYVEDEQIEEGVKRIAKTIKDNM